MRVLVTGGAGFIGSHLCDRLIAEGHEVIAVDNLITGRLVNITHLDGNPRFTFIKHDVTEPLDLPVDQIYHLASPASPTGYMRHPIETHLVNSIGTLNMLRVALARGARFLFTSTSETYGDPHVHPQPETYHGNVNPVGPRSCYDESKRFGESITMDFVRHFSLDARIVRIFNTYGPRSDPFDGRVIPNFIMQTLSGQPVTIYGDGSQTRSLCYVSDMVEGIYAAMNRERTTGEVINLGNPDERTVLDIAHAVFHACGTEGVIQFVPPRVDDPIRRCPDITKAVRLLNWEPRVDLETGLQSTVPSFIEHVSAESELLGER